MLSLDALLISSLLAMPLSAAQQQPPTQPEPPAQPEPAPEPAPEPEPEPEPAPATDEPPADPADAPSQRELQLEEELAEARARAADLERMIDALRQQVAQLRAELAARQAAASAAPAPAAPAPTAPVTRPDDAPKVAPAPRQRSWDEDPADSRPSWTPPPAEAPAAIPADATADAQAFLASIRAAYSSRFPSIPNPAQRDAFDAFTGDVVKWSAAQQRSRRLPVTWSVQLVRVEKGSSKDRVVRFIARSVGRGSSRSGDTFVVRVPRSDADEILKGDYRSATYTVTGNLAPIVRFAPERPYDGISSTHSAFVGPYCEVSIAIDSQSIRPAG